jgi:hypothetical protein
MTKRKAPEDRLPMGRPTKYKPEYCQELIEFFSMPPYREIAETITYKDGTKKETTKLVPNNLPFLFEFAHKIGVETKTLDNWTKEHPDFLHAYKKAKEKQQAFLVNNCLTGLFQQTFGIFTAKNITDWRDQTEVKHEGAVSVHYHFSKPINKK